jgi:hypothetical protein
MGERSVTHHFGFCRFGWLFRVSLAQKSTAFQGWDGK